ncbi:MAG TPA: outer membrane lipoprotein-sorting protein [Bryobacteraceae bacterium]|nr:outer membrane lipoprotein-sorting protein [Bryobacteraceae bacterium]
MLWTLLLLAAVAAGTINVGTPLPVADEVVSRMLQRDNERQAALEGYTAMRRYVLENRDFHKRAEMLVRLTCGKDGSKQFEIVSSSGWGGARKHVFTRLLKAEEEASEPQVRNESRMIPENYSFETVGDEEVNGRRAYVLAVTPKEPKKYLMHGKIWVDAEDYAITRMEGAPVKNPSFWIKSVHFAHTYEKQGAFWLPAADDSVTNVRVFGSTELTIEYFDYSLAH